MEVIIANYSAFYCFDDKIAAVNPPGRGRGGVIQRLVNFPSRKKDRKYKTSRQPSLCIFATD